MPAQFQLKTAKNGKHYFNLMAQNGQVILTSQMYKSKASVKNGIESVRKNGPDSLRYDFRKDRRGECYFVLKAANHQIIGTSESYPTQKVMEKGVRSVIRNSGKAKLKDLTSQP